MTSQAHRSFICDNERGSQLVQQLKYRHGDKDAALFAFLLAEGISLRTHSPSLRVLLFFIVHIVHFSIFILTVGANLLRGDWNIGLGEPRSLPRQTVILRQTPAHPSPSLHLSDLERCFRIPPLSLPPSSALSQRKTMLPSTLLPFQRFPHKISPHGLRISLVAGGGDGALRFQMSLKVKTLGVEAVFCCFPAKHRGKYSWPDFKVAVGSAARLNRHALSALQSRPIKDLIHRFSERKAFNDLLFPWFNTSIVVSAENRGVILLALNAHLM